MANTKMVLVPHSAFSRLMGPNLDKTPEHLFALEYQANKVLKDPSLSLEAKVALYHQTRGNYMQMREEALQQLVPPRQVQPLPSVPPAPTKPKRHRRKAPRPEPRRLVFSDSEESINEEVESTYEKTFLRKLPAPGQTRKRNPPVKWSE